ncbi:MAG: preprotein translocase subunit TatB [Firmicutes bacterium]|nr:preprotein translocase subunit TatB [Bacillota bacterium]
MGNVVNARGLSCPQPVILTLNEIKKVKKGEIIITVDTDTAKENVSRVAKAQGWQVADVQEKDDGYRITIKK